MAIYLTSPTQLTESYYDPKGPWGGVLTKESQGTHYASMHIHARS